jgi:hypothetical protein
MPESKTSLIDLVINHEPDAYRELERFKYKYARSFWAVLLTINEENQVIFENKVTELLSLHNELFFKPLELEYNSLSVLDNMDRDELNTYRHKSSLENFLIKFVKDFNHFSGYLCGLTSEREISKYPTNYPLIFKKNKQPYLPSFEQIIEQVYTITNSAKPGKALHWPYKALELSEIRELQEYGKSYFLYKTLDKIGEKVRAFDMKGGMRFSTFRRVDREINAVYDYMSTFDNSLKLDASQLSYRIQIIYRKIDDSLLNPDTLLKSIKRYGKG